MSARDKLRAFFLENVGKIVDSEQLRVVGEISEWARRVRELRDNEGMQILSHKDRADLKPGEYILVSTQIKPVIDQAISQRLRNEILERNGYTCQFCGRGPGDPDPTNPKRKVTLHIDHIIPKAQGGADEKDNLRVLCSACNQGRSNVQAPSETALNILARIRKAPRAVQREIYETLKRTFGKR